MERKYRNSSEGIAEIELSVLARQGLAHNIATIEDLCQQVQSWQDHRNQKVGTVNWQFRTADAGVKPHPSPSPQGILACRKRNERGTN